MNNLIPVAGTHAPEPRRDRSFERLHQRTRMGVARVEQQTVIDVAQVQRQVIVQSERISGVDSLTRDAMIDCALRDGLVGVLAGENPVLREDLRYFSDIAKLGSGELIIDTVRNFRHQ